MNAEKYREDFPALNQLIGGKPPIYFDNACMTLKPKQVIEAMNEYYEKFPACHGRSVHNFAKKVTERVERSRRRMQDFIGAKKESEIIFTKNTTEGINLVLKNLELGKGDVILTTDHEHNSGLLPCQVAAKRASARHEIVMSNKDETFSMENFEELMSNKVKLVSMVHTSNLNGYTIPAKEIIKIAHDHGALALLDGAQSAPHHEINVKKLDADFFAFSVHKMCGPTGMGVLYGKQHLLEEMEPFLIGGDTVEDSTYHSYELSPPPEKFEAGLQNYAGIMGSAAAAEYLQKIGMKNIHRHELELNRIITKGMQEIDGISIIGPAEPEQRSGIISITSKNIDFHDIAIIMDETKNIMVRSGRFCVHSWFNDRAIEGAVRASVYLYNTEEEAHTYVETLKQIIEQLS